MGFLCYVELLSLMGSGTIFRQGGSVNNKLWLLVAFIFILVFGGAHVFVAYNSMKHDEADMARDREIKRIEVQADYANAARLATLIREKDVEIAAHDSQEQKLYDGKDRYEETKAFIEKSGQLFRERQALTEQYNQIVFDTYGCTFETKSGLPETAEETLPCHL